MVAENTTRFEIVYQFKAKAHVSVCKKVQSDSNLDQLPESTANLISYGIINKRCSYLCHYVELCAVGPSFPPATLSLVHAYAFPVAVTARS